jgi:REP element-mobilizing transposase RayT
VPIQSCGGHLRHAMYRPHPPVLIHSAQILGFHHCGLSEGQERDNFFEKYSRLKRNFRGHSIWARGYYVSTVGLDEAKIRKYIKNQDINESIEDKYDDDLSGPF